MKKIDFHVHLSTDYPIEKSAANLREMCRMNEYETVCIHSLTHLNSQTIPYANETAYQVKQLMPEAFWFGCPEHDGTSYVEQAKKLMEKGADGIKLLIGKPSEYRDLGVKYDDPMIDDFFSFAEQEDIPVLLHHNDPEKHWDKTRMSADSIANGWYYDPASMPSYAYFNEQLEALLARHPKMRIAIAHMGFYAHKLDRLTELMEMYPNLYMDITPALDIYEDLSKESDNAAVFFNRYSKRLIYGTDAWSNLMENDKNGDLNRKKVKVVRHFLCGEGEEVIDGQHTVGIHLSEQQQEDIYYHNSLRFMKK